MSENWLKQKIKDYPVSIIDGDRGLNYPNKSELFCEGHCLFLNTGNVSSTGFEFSNNQFVTEEKDQSLRKGRLVTNDLVLTTRGTIGNVAYFSEKIRFKNIRINSGMLILRPDLEKLNASFFYQLLRSSIFQNQASLFSYGAAQPQLPIGTLKHISLPLPPLPTQQKIAAILFAYDDLIENNNKRIKLLEELAQITYEEWFVRMKFPNHENTPIDEATGLPVGWERKKSEKIAKILIGRTPPRNEEQWFSTNKTTETIPWISIKDMGMTTVFASKTTEFLTKNAVRDFRVPVVEPKTVILSFKLTVGKVAITTQRMCTNEAIAQYSELDQVLTIFLYLYLKSFNFDSLGSSSSIGKAINSKTIKNMIIVVPDILTLNMFNQRLRNVFDEIDNLQNQNQRLKEARDLLLPRLMSGAIDVDSLTIPMETNI
jgi:type I restriction enzyme S subunit